MRELSADDLGSADGTGSARRPNIVLILADDLGFSDLGCYGGEIPTPNLDALAGRGVRFSQFYNTARCSPSRASLLTGLHPHQTGIGVLTRPDLPSGYPGTIDPSRTTIAEVLREAGWETWLSGKWHLSADTTTPNASWPTRRGFRRFFGTLAGCSSYFDPQTLTRDETPATDALDDPSFYYTDAISEQAAAWVGEQDVTSTDPFFLYLAYTAPHWPLHARPEDLEAVRGLFDDGWDRLREARLRRLTALGVLPEGTRLSDRDPSQPPFDDVMDKAWDVARMEAYAAQVVALDRGVGTVLSAVARTGRLDDTVVLFLSDNGASAEELPIGTPESFAAKDAVLRDGTRGGAVVRVGNDPAVLPGAEDTYASYGVAWANLSNTPMRRYKRWVHEGGISTPLVVAWPHGALAEGAVVDLPAQLVDIVPTLCEAAGVTSGAGEGRSLLGAMRGEEAEEAPLYWEHIGNAALRRGRWKLVRDHPGPWELYDLAQDRTELDDLAPRCPALVGDLSLEWERWARRVGVLSWDAMVERYREAGRDPAAAEE